MLCYRIRVHPRLCHDIEYIDSLYDEIIRNPLSVLDIEEKINELSEVHQVKIDLVFDPPWDRDKMTDEAKLQLGLL